MSKLSFNGIGNLTRVTINLDSTTTTAIQDDIYQIQGKTVALTGDAEVGYGASGDAIFGIVGVVEPFSSGKEKLVVGIYTDGFVTEVFADGVATKDYVTCDGEGGFAKAATGTTNAQVVELDADTKEATIFLK